MVALSKSKGTTMPHLSFGELASLLECVKHEEERSYYNLKISFQEMFLEPYHLLYANDNFFLECHLLSSTDIETLSVKTTCALTYAAAIRARRQQAIFICQETGERFTVREYEQDDSQISLLLEQYVS